MGDCQKSKTSKLIFLNTAIIIVLVNYRPNWTPLCPITIIYWKLLLEV